LRIPPERAGDVVLIDPTDADFPIAINPLECRDAEQRHFMAQSLLDVIMRLMRDQYGDTLGTMTGPIFEQYVRMNLLLVMADPDQRVGTLLDFYELFNQRNYWRHWVPRSTSDPLLKAWVEQILPNRDMSRTGSEQVSMGEYISSKFMQFVFNPSLRNIFGQRHSTVDFGRFMSDRRIVLVNLAKGTLGEGNSRFIGMVLLTMVQAAALARGRLPQRDRSPFYLYVDEFQSIATSSFVTLLSEGRKFGIGLTLANQFLSQVQEQRIVDALFGNVGSLVAFRLGAKDADLIEPRLAPVFGRTDLVNLPNWHACVSMMEHNALVAPFSIRTEPVQLPPNDALADEVLTLSRRRYARPREEAVADTSAELDAFLRRSAEES
jgi:hypothetical protein